jgi:hypothetical protein
MILLAVSANAAQYYVRPDGADTNDGLANVADTGGTAAQAWLTIQKAANTMTAGDTVTVVAGSYPEYVATVNAGSVGNPITYNTSGTVYCYGFNISDAYTVVNGFTFRYTSRQSLGEGIVYFNQNGSNSTVENCTFGPGISKKATDWVFADTNPDTITTATGGLTAAGFRAGMYLRVANSETNADTLNVNAQWLVSSVTDTTITLDGAVAVTAESGKKAFLYGQARGVTFYSTVSNCTIKNNVFPKLSFEGILMAGSGGHLVEGNVINDPNGFDGILYTGANCTIRRNLVKNGLTFEYYDPSPDLLSNLSPGTINNILIEENMVIDQLGALGFDHGVPGSGLTFRRNVFVNCGGAYLLKTGNVLFENNTFYLVAYAGTAVVQSMDFAIDWSDESSNHTSATINNNIIVACGAAAAATKGWYRTQEPAMTITANYNMVAGASPTFGTKTGFSEPNGINGGDPMFVDPSDPVGPDGLIFTADDGMRLSSGSPAIGTGPAGADLGAYDYEASPGGSGTLNATTTNATTVTVGP